jgi:hypothetical protein
MIKKLIAHLTQNPRTLFLADSSGALLSAFFLFVILKNFNAYFGTPETVLNYLSAIAVCFCIYSAACFLFLKGNWTLYIRVISRANLLYCILTLSLLVSYFPLHTYLGITYFLTEIAVIGVLVYIELNVAAAI